MTSVLKCYFFLSCQCESSRHGPEEIVIICRMLQRKYSCMLVLHLAQGHDAVPAGLVCGGLVFEIHRKGNEECKKKKKKD